MGLRFRKSVRICPGVRLNFSKSGVSTTVGGRGFSVASGSRGTYVNTGIPGTGLSYREKISGGSGTREKGANQRQSKENIAAYERELERRVEAINNYMDEYNNIALLTPEVDDLLEYQPQPFKPPKPSLTLELPKSFQIGIFALLTALYFIFGIKVSIWVTGIILVVGMLYYRKKTKLKEAELIEQWDEQKKIFLSNEKQKHDQVAEILENNAEDPESAYALGLDFISWPYETNVSFEVGGDTIKIDVDLPEIEDIENQNVVVKGRGANKHMEKVEKSARQTRQDYAQHIHGIGMVLTGLAFNVLNNISTVVISAYSQRLSTTTGNYNDEYLYSVKIPRAEWLKVNLKNKEHLDPILVLGMFEIRRNMTSTAVFKPITPFAEGTVENRENYKGNVLDGSAWVQQKTHEFLCGGASDSKLSYRGKDKDISEHGLYDVILTAHGDGTSSTKINLIKALREVIGLGIHEAKEAVDNAPSTIARGVPREKAEQIREAAENYGGEVEIKKA